VTLRADATWTEAALELLDKQTLLYANTVPRGAQTWEIPLHTPDILAAGLRFRRGLQRLDPDPGAE